MIAISKLANEEPATTMIDDDSIEADDCNDCCTCAKCSSPVLILSINDKECTVTYKCLNPNEEESHKIQTMPISEYISSMKKFTYMNSQCYICKKLQNESKDIPIFSCCIKCGKIICNDCINEHLRSNEGNHPNMSKEYIIKVNEIGTRCKDHPNEKYTAFCFGCKKHLCNKCMGSREHLMHIKNTLLEVKPNKEMNEKLNGIINIYKEKIKQELKIMK